MVAMCRIEGTPATKTVRLARPVAGDGGGQGAEDRAAAPGLPRRGRAPVPDDDPAFLRERRAMRKKITVVGAGRVGETTAHILAERALGDLVLVDIVPNLAAGKALDLMQLRPLAGANVTITGTTS